MRCTDHLRRRLTLLLAGGPLAACALPPGWPGTGAAPSTQAAAAAQPSQPARQPPRNWEQFRLQAAHRLVAANPGQTYDGTPPDVLLAIPVLEIDLNADGSVRRIQVMRYPKQARDTVEIAMAAVRRAAPFGSVSHLPRPWRFTETFLFNDERRFKPRILDRR